MKKGWEVKPLESVATIVNGGTPKTDEPSYWGGSHFWVTPAEMGNRSTPYIATTIRTLTNAGLNNSSAKLVPPNSVILSTRAPIGHLVINSSPMATNQGCRAIVPSPQIYYKYLYYYLLKNKVELDALGNGSTFKELATSKLKSFFIRFPHLSEQHRIVAILDDAFARIDKAIENTEKNIANAKELSESYLESYFRWAKDDWNYKTLEEISIDFGRGKSKHRPRNDPSLYNGEYPFIQTGDVRNSNQYICEYTQTYNEKGLAQSKLWPSGTVCITIAANIAEIGILTFNSCFPDSIIGVTVDNKNYSNEYLYYILQFMSGELKKEGKGSAQDNINLGTFEKRTFPFPAFDEQQRIVTALNELYTQTKSTAGKYKAKLTALHTLKQSLLSAAFSGELTADFNPNALEV